MSDPQQQPQPQPTPQQQTLAIVLGIVSAMALAAFAEAQTQLIKSFAALILKYGVGDLLLYRMRSTAKATVAKLQAETPALAEKIIGKAVLEGGSGGHGTTPPQFGVAGDSWESHAERSARAIREDLAGKLNSLGYGITRFADDAYKAVTADAATRQVFAMTPAGAQGTAYRDLLRKGITGFTDNRGRNWELSAYVEMATRTAAQRAYNVSHLDRMLSVGVEYFTVTDDGHPCPLCLPWQGQVLSATVPDGVASATVAEATAAGLFHPNCFPGFVEVSAPSAVRAADSRWYDGEVVVINTAAGNELTVTPNHPVLTPDGWVAAGELVVGQSVIRYGVDVERVDGMGPNDELVKAPIGDVYHALRESSGVTTVTMPSSAEQFHGDGGNGDVEVVLVNGELQNGVQSTEAEGVSDGALFVGGVRFSDLASDGALDEFGVRSGASADGLVGVGGERLSLCAGHAAEAAAHGLTEVGPDTPADKPLADFGLRGAEPCTDLALGESIQAKGDSLIEPRGFAPGGEPVVFDASGSQSSVDHIRADAEGGRQLARTLSAAVAPDQIIHVERRDFSGHVYNLQTSGEWYVANSIVAHNCRHTLVAFFPGRTELPAPHEFTADDAQRYKVSQQQRALERDIRAAKRQLDGAVYPDDVTAAKFQLRRAQARMRDFIDQTGRVRNTRREQLNLGG